MATHDAIIVGGGLGGLCAARWLLLAGKRVLLLEAQDRVGGRTKTVPLPLHPQHLVDVGGQWLGPLHTRMLALWHDLGIPLVEQYSQGADLLDDGVKVRRSLNVGSNIPRIGPLALLQLQIKVINRLKALTKQLPPLDAALESTATTRATKKAARTLHALDSLTVEQWLRRQCWFGSSARLGALCIEMFFGCEPAQIGMLQFVQYLRANGGIDFLSEVRNGAQEVWAGDGGAGRAAPLLLAKLRAEHPEHFEARLSCPAVEVRAEGELLQIRTAAGDVLGARHALLAIPPTAALERVRISPPPPVAWLHAAQRSFIGCYTKAIAVFDEPFWRARGLSGTAMRVKWDREHPVANVYDHSEPPRDEGSVEYAQPYDAAAAAAASAPPSVPPSAPRASGPPAALTCFLAADAAMLYAGASDDELREAVLRSLSRLFGAEVRTRLVDFVYCEWTKDEWSRGCPVNLLPAGHYASHNMALRAPLLEGRLHWASTEAAEFGTGYMEGAVRAGEAAAARVIASLDAPPTGESHHSSSGGAESSGSAGWAWCGSGSRDRV